MTGKFSNSKNANWGTPFKLHHTGNMAGCTIVSVSILGFTNISIRKKKTPGCRLHQTKVKFWNILERLDIGIWNMELFMRVVS